MHSADEATAIIETFLSTAWSGVDRHQRRIDLVAAYEETGELA
jgi:ribose 5-phosphate isomerase B